VLHESTDVGELIAAAIESLGPRGAEVTADVPVSLPRVSTDPVLLERAVANLVDNALIHARGRGLRIEAGPVAGRVDIRVIDRGPGIPREDRDVVFLPFQRLGDAEHRVGVGLGLAVSRGFVEAAGGELDVEDTPGGGCTMVIRLPATDPVDEPDPEAPDGLAPAPPTEAGSRSGTMP
jgi:two-component system sensor histidine kinase KdpD